MCVIIHKKSGVTLNKDTLKECCDRNSNGAGFIVRRDGEFIYQKSLMTFDSYFEAISPFIGPDNELFTHMRISSRGGISDSLTHPFEVTLSKKTRAFLFHNGTANCVEALPTGWSDTRFIAEILRGLSFKSAKSILENLNSKGQGRFVLVSLEDTFIKGDEESVLKNDIWFSNLRHEVKAAQTTFTHQQHQQHYNPVHTPTHYQGGARQAPASSQLALIPYKTSDFSYFVVKTDGTETASPSRDDLYAIIAKSLVDFNTEEEDAASAIICDQYKLDNVPLRYLVSIAQMASTGEFENPVEEFFSNFN